MVKVATIPQAVFESSIESAALGGSDITQECIPYVDYVNKVGDFWAKTCYRS